MNHLLFFTVNDLLSGGHTQDDKEFQSIKESIGDVDIGDDFILDFTKPINRANFSSEISKANYKIIYFPYSCSFEEKGLRINSIDSEAPDFISLSSLEQSFQALNNDFLGLIFNGNNGNRSNLQAKSLARYSNFTIGTHRAINLEETRSFASNFFKILAENRVVYSLTLLEAFFKGQDDNHLFKNEDVSKRPYSLFTKIK